MSWLSQSDILKLAESFEDHINDPPGLLKSYRAKWLRLGESVSSSYSKALRMMVLSGTEWFSNSSDTVAHSDVGRSRVGIIRMFLDEIWVEPGMVEIGGNRYPQAAPEL